MTAEVVTLYDTNARDIPATLRKLADDVEQGQYGEVSEIAVALMGNTFELFAMGPTCDGTSTHALLHAGMLRIASEIESCGK